MRISDGDAGIQSDFLMSSMSGEGSPRAIVPLLEGLLRNSVRLRDLYRSARLHTSVSPLPQLRQVFDEHYREQLRLVDVLIDRVRMLGGADRILAGDLLPGNQFSRMLRGRDARTRLLQELVDAHESILSAARPSGGGNERKDCTWIRDFAVGQVILANERQIRSIGDLLTGGSDDRSLSVSVELIAD
jgi:starvation-inducible DNA-binding protein